MIVLFFLVATISFLGSLHPGAVNLAVVQTTLTRSRWAGAWLALGGSLPEVVYGFAAAYGLTRFNAADGWFSVLQVASVPLLLLTGLAALRPRVAPSSSAARMNRAPFWKGLALAGANPQLLPFWSAVWVALGSAMLVPVGMTASPWVFALGTAAGAFALLMGLVWLADRYRAHVVRVLAGARLRWLTAGTFVGMALWQAIRLWA